MRLLELLAICGAMLAFFSAWKAVHEALPQLIADATARADIERCVAQVGFMLIIGICAVGFGALCLSEAQTSWLKKQMDKQERAMDERVHALERENKRKDKLLGRIEALEEKSRLRSWPTP